MKRKSIWKPSALILASTLAAAAALSADEITDWGLTVQRALRDHSQQLFGITAPLTASATGPFTGADSVAALELAAPLRASLVSSSVHPSTDMIALWPNDDQPTDLFVCSESDATFGVMR